MFTKQPIFKLKLNQLSITKDKNFSSLESSYGLRAVKEILNNPTPITSAEVKERLEVNTEEEDDK